MSDTFKPLEFVEVDQVTSDELKAKVDKWPPDILRVELGSETVYYHLAPFLKQPDAHDPYKPCPNCGWITAPDLRAICALCNGSGTVSEHEADAPCPDCNGLGYWL